MRDNQNHLKGRLDNSVSRTISGATDYATTAAQWVDIEAEELALNLNTDGGSVLVGFAGTVNNSGNGKPTYFNIAVDDSNYFADHGFTGLTNAGTHDAGRFKPLCFVVLIAGLSAGAHTFKLRWKTGSSNVARISVSKLKPQFWAKEI